MSTPDIAIAFIGIVVSVAAGVLWLRASLIEVPDELGTFIGELQRIGRINAYAAWAACAAAACAAYAFGRSAGWL